MKEERDRNSLKSVHGHNRALGILGEELAAGYLEMEGYEILCRNYRCPYGEIDVIARKDGYTAFVEVKTRTGNGYGQPAEAVGRAKQRKIRQSAAFYLTEQGEKEGRWGYSRGNEFQVIEVLVCHRRGLHFREAE